MKYYIIPNKFHFIDSSWKFNIGWTLFAFENCL